MQHDKRKPSTPAATSFNPVESIQNITDRRRSVLADRKRLTRIHPASTACPDGVRFASLG